MNIHATASRPVQGAPAQLTDIILSDMAPSPEPSPLPLMQLSIGFWAFKTLAAAHELGLFAHLSRKGATTADALAADFNIDRRPAEMLLTGCASLGLLEASHGRFRNAPASEAYLVPGKPHYFGGWIEMADKRLYAGWGKLTEALRTNRPTTWNPDVQASLFDGEDPKMLKLFWEAMHSLSTMTAQALGRAFDFSPYQRLLDIGGGSGAFDIELCRAYPGLTASVFDLPHVTEIAAWKIAEAELTHRIGTIGGSFFGEFAQGHDVHLYSMIMHDWDEAKNRALLRKSYDALRAGGAVVISELLVDDDKTGPAPAALMSLNMLIETEGRNYTAAEYATWLRDAGFTDIETVRFDAPGANGAVIGFKS